MLVPWSARAFAPAPAPAPAPAEDPQTAQNTQAEPAPVEPQGSDDPSLAQFEQIRELVVEGEARFKQQDYVGAIEPWQQAYELLTLCERVQLFVPLASAHWRAYQTDLNQEHLRQAKAMFDRGLESVGVMDEWTRRDAQAQLAEVEAEIDRLQAARLQQEQEQAARDAVEQERQRERERQQRAQAVEREAQLQRTQRRIRISMGIGAASVGLGIGSLSAMVVGLRLGANTERAGAASADDPNSTYEARQDLLDQGENFNRMAWTTGIIGGALVAAGTTLLVVNTIRRRRLPRQPQTQARLAPRLYSMEVRF